MNILIEDNRIHRYEKLYRQHKKIHRENYDLNGTPFPYLKKEKKFTKKQKHVMNKFTHKLGRIEKKLKVSKETGMYSVFNTHWNPKLKYYIKEFNTKPTKEFMQFIKRLSVSKNKIKIKKELKNDIVLRLPSVIFKKGKQKYIKLSQNQLRILDALMNDGGFDKKYVDSKKKLRHSEHLGLLDFSNTGLEKIIVSAKTNRIDPEDHTILLPQNMIETYDYEYIFHTHPPTPRPGARLTDGILYEFPSVSDVFHFMDHYNTGATQGSLVMAPEGVYIIYAIDRKQKIQILNEDEVFDKLNDCVEDIQVKAITKYGAKLSDSYFYYKIAQDTAYIKLFNKELKKYNIKIYYKPRIKFKGKWIIKDLYLKVSAIEPYYK
jgi:hypothetical protein